MVSMNTFDTSHIRNFSIVAHIDHGKSTISDRILELTRTVEERDMESQLLDTMDIERERGITIKSNAVRVMYDADDGETYQFNLIDTPGHVDFTYEVSRSLAACEGAVLVVDATQGVEAQTVSNASLAMNADLDIVPAINKIDLPSAHPEEVKVEIEDELAIPADDAVCVSGKTGEGIHDLLEAIVFLVSPPKGDANKPLKALILDSYFDEYRGVVATVRIFDGQVKKGDHLRMMQGGEVVRMSKRTGKSLTLTDLLDEIPVDAARFFFNSRAAETQMEFDLDLAIKQDSDNPLYYVQYAHARICSVLRNAQESGIALPDTGKTDLSVLTGADERQLIKQVALLPEEIVQSAVSRDPSRLNKYAVALAQQFHHFYNACRIKDAEPAVRDARLTLCLAAKQTIENVLKLIGVDAPESM